MLKRANKITALIIVAACIMSIVPAMASDTTAKFGWSQLENGNWSFYDAIGNKVANNWVGIGGDWYYFNADGAMCIGWIFDNGNWYYLNSNGKMLSNTTIDGYVLNDSGAWVE